MLRFILQAVDPVLGCSVLEAMPLVIDFDALRVTPDSDPGSNAEVRCVYDLAPADLAAINDRYGRDFDPDGRRCVLSRLHAIDDAP